MKDLFLALSLVFRLLLIVLIPLVKRAFVLGADLISESRVRSFRFLLDFRLKGKLLVGFGLRSSCSAVVNPDHSVLPENPVFFSQL